MSDEREVNEPHNVPEPEGYDAWFRMQVELALHEADDPNARSYTLEESNEKMHLLKIARRAQQLQKAS